ncbi:hypothetical protein BS78_05G239800 [Paspalum vaginatum]|nr:hypothetical protein BS78_05G239800 [Paspalum vaginatum]
MRTAAPRVQTPTGPRLLPRSLRPSLHLRQPLEQQRCLLARRLPSSSVPTERCKNFPSGTRPSNSMEQKKHHNDDEEDINRRLLREIDMVSDYVYEQAWWSNCTMGCVNTSLFPVVCSL